MYTVIVDRRRCNKCMKCEEPLPGLLMFPYGMDFKNALYMFMEDKIDEALAVCECEALTLRIS